MFLQHHVPLAPLTTFGIGGPTRWFVAAHNPSDVIEAVQWARAERVRLFVLGGGSNLLVDDAGYPGLVLRIVSKGIVRTQPEDGNAAYTVAAGEDWDNFVGIAVREGNAGLECLSGIPGTVGGTPVQNVGAYGQETSQVLTAVTAVDTWGVETVGLTSEECGFSYRGSRFNGAESGRYILTEVEYSLRHGGAPTVAYPDLKREFLFAGRSGPSLDAVRNAVLAIRLKKGMVVWPPHADMRSAGSFFKNPVVEESVVSHFHAQSGEEIPMYPAGDGRAKLSAAWLVEHAGFPKGFGEGPAGISTRHTLALVNRGGASCADMLNLRDRIVAGVERSFGISLTMEPVRLTAGSGAVPGSN